MVSKESTKSILVVEDEPSLQEAVRLKLAQKGVTVITADSGEEAIQKIKEHRPSLVWLDIMLPGMSGLDVLHWLRQEKEYKDLPAVIVSVSGSREHIAKANNLGVKAYIIKSEHTIDAIVTKVKSFL
jgi:two-component system alkaline phosphatase synthesis response regulator PhoP